MSSVEGCTPPGVCGVDTPGVQDAPNSQSVLPPTKASNTLLLAVFGGAVVAVGALAGVTAVTGSTLPFGVSRLLGGAVSGLGFVFAILAGGTVYATHVRSVQAWVGGALSGLRLARVLLLALTGNAVGAVLVAGLAFVGGHHLMGQGMVGATTLAIASATCQLDPVQALALGALCGALLSMAAWLGMRASSVGGRLGVMVPLLSVCGLVGLEHAASVLFVVPSALLIKMAAPAEFWVALDHAPAEFTALTIDQFLINALVPITLGNLVGGVAVVGLAAWWMGRKARVAPVN